ncbi:hypothetical protein RB195_013987 [Necator americanus]|uniref:Uncharacterized protein n=1 Tax=Necator americanus TaxID=51031 RepID=A0ABR1DZM9_NECAM
MREPPRSPYSTTPYTDTPPEIRITRFVLVFPCKKNFMLFVMVLLAHFFLIASVIVCLGGHRDQEPSSGEFSAESCSSSSLSEDKSTRKVAGDSTARGRRERVKHKKRGRGSKAKKSHHSLKREKRNGGKKSITKKQNVKEEQLKEKESEDSSSPEDIYAEDTINECKSEWGKEMPYIKASGKQLGLKQGKKSRDYLPLALDDTPSSPNGLDPACEQKKDIPSSSDIFNLSREQKTQTLPIEYDEKEKIKSKNVTEKTTRKDQCAFHSAEKLQKESEMYVEQKTQRCNSEKRKEVGQFSQHYLHTPVLKLPRQKLMGCTHTTDNKPPSKFSSKICPGTSLHGKNLQGSSENLELGFFNAGSKEKLTSSSSQGVQSRESMKNLALKQRSKTFSNERIRNSFAENKVPLCNEATQRSLEGGDIMRHDFMRGGKVQSKESLRSTNDLLGQNYKPKRVLPERNRVMQSQDVISSDSAESRKQSKDKFQSDEGYKFKSVSSESKVIGQSSEDDNVYSPLVFFLTTCGLIRSRVGTEFGAGHYSRRTFNDT